MMRLLTLAFLSALLVFALPMSAYAADKVLSPAEVVVLDPAVDGSEIVVEGEAIADVLRAVGGGKWLNILDDEVGLGIWTDEAMLEPIEYYGDYDYDGDTVRVAGTLNMTCEQHGGEFDVHARSIEIVSVGQPREHEPRLILGLVGLVGMIVGGALLFRYRKLRD